MNALKSVARTQRVEQSPRQQWLICIYACMHVVPMYKNFQNHERVILFITEHARLIESHVGPIIIIVDIIHQCTPTTILSILFFGYLMK